MFEFISAAKAITEIVLFCLIGQGILFVFAGESRERNGVYRLFAYINKPAWKFARFLTPRMVMDRHIGLVAFFLFGFIWVLLVAAKIYVFVQLKRSGG